MLIEDIFYIVFWNTMILTLWFKTDVILDYCRLLNIFNKFQTKVIKFLKTNPHLYFPDFLYEQTKKSSIPIQFLGKLISCPVCLSVWTTTVLILIYGSSLVNLAPCYVISLCLFIGIKKLW
jgi:hypothetical protein